MAHDYNFLKESLKYTIQVDEFTRNLFEIYETVRAEGSPQVIFSLDFFAPVIRCSAAGKCDDKV